MFGFNAVSSNLRMEEQGSTKARITFVFFIVLLVFGGICIRLFQKQVIQHAHYEQLAYDQRYKEQKIMPARGEIYVGDIYSDTHYPLVTNKTFWSVMIIPQQVEDENAVANGLGPIIDMPAADILKLLNEKKVYIPPLKRKLPDEVSKKIEALKLPGIVLIPETYRDYPEGSMGAKFLGFVDGEGEGKYGIEGYLNDVLKGQEGKIISERDILGRQITVADSKVVMPKNGKDVVLTIDRVIQFMAENQVKKAVEDHKADSGSIVVMDAKSGGILALAEWPTYDPAKYTDVKDYSIFQCNAISDAYEPGSVFKLIAMAAGIDSGTVTPETGEYFDANVKVQDAVIWNSQKKPYGYETMTQVLENSDNVGMVWMIQKTGKDKFYDYVNSFNFGKRTGIEIDGESPGAVRDKEDAIPVDLATMSFGQGINTTEIQLAQAMGAVANGGLMVAPHIVKEYIDKNGKVQKVDPKIIGRALSEDSAKKITEMMVSVAERGHGKQARVKGYRIGGKTGTAQIPRKTGGYETDKFIGSFIGFGPTDNPLFVMVVRINVPKDVIWAESTAAPVFGEMAKGILNYYQIPPDEVWKEEQIKREKGLVK
ncbi:MAG TPA: penicillin-binding protein 2 [Patescibacteria group bacterium]|nr:penicillin-binding protein 2 [Patescibacteria group bacterium]